MKTTTLISLAVVALVIAACGDEPAPVTSAPSQPAVTTPAGSVSTTAPDPTASDPTPPASELTEDQQTTIRLAKADLAARTGVDVTEIELESFAAVTWNDGALGCPKPGEFYTQALVDGSRTVLVADGMTYHYHAADGRSPFLCERPELLGGPGVTLPPDNDS